MWGHEGVDQNVETDETKVKESQFRVQKLSKLCGRREADQEKGCESK